MEIYRNGQQFKEQRHPRHTYEIPANLLPISKNRPQSMNATMWISGSVWPSGDSSICDIRRRDFDHSDELLELDSAERRRAMADGETSMDGRSRKRMVRKRRYHID